MACDIHMFTEIKVNEEWLLYNQPRVERNYMLFAKMAGVRNSKTWEIQPISNPKGIPADAISRVTDFRFVFYFLG